MSEAEDRKRALRETLKRLRTERAEQVKAANTASATVRAERKKVVAAMAQDSRSVPQLAAATELPTDRVLWHIAAMRKYGQIVEVPDKDGDYFMYALAPDAARKAAKSDDDSGGS
ncbi:MAG: winged helix-turn-helix domain-containing protein [Thermoleophilia bacterium]|nr:winged helix-turn-helix domain-containing protein [Thermoleophilia bacterium]